MRRGFRREIAALEEVFRFLEGFFDEAAIDGDVAFTVSLVAEELFTNMVRHNVGGGARIELGIERDGDRLLLELVDEGVDRFDPDEIPKPPVAAAIGQRHPGGLGLHLVRTMVDDLSFEYQPHARRMRVSVTKRLET